MNHGTLATRGAPVFLLLLLAICGREACAEADSPATLESVQVTATRVERLVFDVAQAATLVERDEIQRESPQVLAEAMRGRVGTFFQQTTPGQGTAIIRGLKGSQILHLVDGMRLNNAFFRSAPNQYLALVDPYATDRMEVIRGTAGTLYGSDAMGGVVQVLTEEQRFDDTDWSLSGEAYTAYEHADRGRILRTQAATGRAGLSLAGGLTWQDYNDRRTGRERVRGSDYDSSAADAKLLWDMGDAAELMLSYQYLDQPNTPRVDELVPGFGQDEPSSEEFSFRPNQREFFHARLRYTPDWRWLDQVELHLAEQTITDDRRTQDFGSTVTTNEDNESELLGFTLQLDSRLSDRALLTYGLEVYRDDIASSRRETDSSTGITQTVPSRFPDGSELDSVAAYLYGEWDPAPSLTIGGGLRYSAFDITLPQEAGPDVDLEPDDVSGDLHLTWRVNDSLRVVGNLGRGFRAPNIFDLGTLGSRPGNRFNVANTDLDTETVWSFDAGFKVNRPRWRAEIFGFYADYDDKITSVETGEVTPGGRTVVRSDNANQLEIYGLEAGAYVDVLDAVELYGVLNYARGDEEDADGNEEPADRMPPLNGKVGVVVAPGPRLRFDSFLLFANEQDRLSARDKRDPRIDPEGTASWGSVNAAVDWKPIPDVSVGIRGENLFDNSHREHGSGIDSPGRSLTAWLKIAFD